MKAVKCLGAVAMQNQAQPQHIDLYVNTESDLYKRFSLWERDIVRIIDAYDIDLDRIRKDIEEEKNVPF